MGLKTKLGVSLAAGAISIATAVVSFYEGYEPTAYRDPVGIPAICYGHTATVRMGQTLSQAECTALLQQDLGEAFAVVDRRAKVELPEPTRAAPRLARARRSAAAVGTPRHASRPPRRARGSARRHRHRRHC